MWVLKSSFSYLLSIITIKVTILFIMKKITSYGPPINTEILITCKQSVLVRVLSCKHTLGEEFLFFFLRFIYLFLERGEGRQRGREILTCKRYINWLPLAQPQLGTWHTTPVCILTGNWTRDLSVCRPALTPLSHTSQGVSEEFLEKILSSS